MRTVTKEYKLYKYDELEDDAKERAHMDYLRDGIVYEWWDFVYDDAKQVGLEITSFDTYRHEIEGNLLISVHESVQAIIDNHGDTTDTYKLALDYYRRKHVRDPYDVDEWTHALLEEYLVMLRRELEYLESEESFKEMCEANEWEFKENGEIF